jgi:HSP20 family protein
MNMSYQPDPFEMMADLRRRLLRLLETSGPAPTPPPAAFSPPLDIVQAPEGVVITVEVPGIVREDVDVSLEGNRLTISGERKPCPALAAGRLHHRERQLGRFSRSLSLAGDGPREITASLNGGVLTVTVSPASGEGGGR